VAPWIEGDDLGGVVPRVIRRDRYRGFGVAVVGLMSGVEGPHSDGKSAVDRVRTGMGTQGVALFDGGRKTRTDNGSTSDGV